MRSTLFLIIGLVLYFSYYATGQKIYPPVIECSKEVVFKKVEDTELKLWIFNPPKHNVTDKKPAIVFFFGGGWNGGSPSQFVPHCEYLSERGMVAMVADYRVKSRNNVLANKCVSDAKSAVRWIRENASELGIDPERIAAGGGSAGGHLAAATALLSEFEEKNENKNISSKPNALVLFNPALVLAPTKNLDEEFNKKLEGLHKRMGVEPMRMSPYHHINSGMSPCIIFHGTADSTVPFITVKMFAEKMKKNGNKCILVAYEAEPHGFFNYGKKQNGPFIDTVNKMDKFLISIGYLLSVPASSEI